MKRVPELLRAARSMAFVYLVAVITAVGSERMFWFWTPGLRSHLEVAAFYAIASATGIMLMRRHRVDSWWSLMLAVPVVAYVVEGVITPVLYSRGAVRALLPGVVHDVARSSKTFRLATGSPRPGPGVRG